MRYIPFPTASTLLRFAALIICLPLSGCKESTPQTSTPSEPKTHFGQALESARDTSAAVSLKNQQVQEEINELGDEQQTPEE